MFLQHIENYTSASFSEGEHFNLAQSNFTYTAYSTNISIGYNFVTTYEKLQFMDEISNMRNTQFQDIDLRWYLYLLSSKGFCIKTLLYLSEVYQSRKMDGKNFFFFHLPHAFFLGCSTVWFHKKILFQKSLSVTPHLFNTRNINAKTVQFL